ncbi:MAG: hypothetical protein ACTSRU_04050 [Candidatus Hodarchaeales archaeon]
MMTFYSKIISLITRFSFLMFIVVMILIGIFIMNDVILQQDLPVINPKNPTELISFLSPLIIIPVLIMYLKLYSNRDFSGKNTSIIYLERTAYLPNIKTRLVVYKCNINGITIVNSLLALLELLPLSIVLHPKTNQIYFIFHGSELSILRDNCQKGEICLKNVFSKVVRLEKAELIVFLDFFYNEEIIESNKGSYFEILTSKELRETVNRFSEFITNGMQNDISYTDNSFLLSMKESESCIFIFRSNHSRKGSNNSVLIEITDQTLYYSNIFIQEMSQDERGKDQSDSPSPKIDLNKILLEGFNPEISVDAGIFTDFVELLRILDSNREQLMDDSEEDVLSVKESEIPSFKDIPTERTGEQITSLEIVDSRDELDTNDLSFRFNSPFCDICSKFSDLDGSRKRIDCCIPNLTFSYDKLCDIDILSRMKSLKQESFDQFTDYLSLILDRCSIPQIICFYSVLCFSNQFSPVLSKTEKNAIVQYLSSFLTEQSNNAGNTWHRGSENAINII